MKKMTHKTSFSATLRPLVTEEKDKYLALASLMDIGDFIPDIDTSANVDLLPVAFNAFVANRINKNGDVLNTNTAVDIYKNFINKPINLEHNRERVVGVILSASFSEFGTDKSIADVRNMMKPFNVTLGGVIWKVVSNDLTDVIEDSNDPTSENYQKISASWELGFEDYDLVALNEGEKNIENGTFITDPGEIEANKEHLRSNGGEGVLDSGQYVYRQVKGQVVPLGIGLTESPAADVQGVAVKPKEEEPKDSHDRWAKEDLRERELETKIKFESSQKTIDNVDNTINKDKNTMNKLTSIKDITDESLKQLSASAVSEFIEQELDRHAQEYDEQTKKAQSILESAEDNHKQLEDEHQKLEDELSKIKEALEALELEKSERQAEEEFNQRMASLDEEYTLSDNERGVIATDIKELSAENFDNYKTKMAIFLTKKSEAVKEEVVKEKTEAASEDVQDEQNEQVAEEVLDNAEIEASEVPVSSEVKEPTMYDRYKSAFAFDQFNIKH